MWFQMWKRLHRYGILCSSTDGEGKRTQYEDVHAFVDLRKAYDSVFRQALWSVLQKYGIPPVLVTIIRSLHDGTRAEVAVDGATTSEIEVSNGLRQGCTIAPPLFNLFSTSL